MNMDENVMKMKMGKKAAAAGHIACLYYYCVEHNSEFTLNCV